MIEVMVSVMIFSIVMTVALGALLAMSESDRKAEALKSVINNFNFALDNMSRTIHTGYNYHCGTGGNDLNVPKDCDTAGASQPYLAVRGADGSRIAYCLDAGFIKRQVIPASDTTGNLSTTCGSAAFLPLTSTEVNVATLQFIVTGSCPQSIGDIAGQCTAGSANKQPKVTILITGSVKTTGSQVTPLNLQTSVTQRVYDQ